MSCQTAIVYGFGFSIDCDDATLIEFIKNHKDAFCGNNAEKELYKEICDNEDVDLYDILADYACENTGREGPYAVVSNIMSRETNIDFSYEPGDADCGSDPAILLPETMPWFLNETEKALTKESLTGIYEKYMNELGIKEKPDYVKIEYFG